MRGQGMSADYISETISSACSIAAALKAAGDKKGAREILNRVAEIQDRVLYLSGSTRPTVRRAAIRERSTMDFNNTTNTKEQSNVHQD